MKTQQEVMPCDFHYHVIASYQDQDKQKPEKTYFQACDISSDSRYSRNYTFQLFQKAFMITIVANLPLI